MLKPIVRAISEALDEILERKAKAAPLGNLTYFMNFTEPPPWEVPYIIKHWGGQERGQKEYFIGRYGYYEPTEGQALPFSWDQLPASIGLAEFDVIAAPRDGVPGQARYQLYGRTVALVQAPQCWLEA